MNAGAIYVHLRANMAHLEKGMRKASSLVARFGNRARKMISSIPWKQIAVGAGVAVTGLAVAVHKFTGSVITAASTSEQYRVRLNALLGSTQEGARLFKEMTDFASKVPFTYEKIMGSATALAGVMKGGVDEISKWMPMIADLAAVSGLTLEDTTSQVIRMYSAGAAAADMFRERGILAMLGFKAGVSYSVEETRQMMFDAWNSSSSQFKGATEALANTWKGLMSMFSDLWFNFKNMIAKAGIFDYLKQEFSALKDWLNEMKDSGVLQQWAQSISDVLVAVYRKVWEFIWFIVENWPKVIDAIGKFGEFIKTYILPALEFLRQKFVEVVKYVYDNWSTITKKFEEIKSALVNYVIPAFKGLYKVLKWIVNLFRDIKNAYDKLPDFLKGTHPVIKWIVKFLGEGSSQKPLTEKLSELSGKVQNFSSLIESQRPRFEVDITGAMNKLSQVSQKAAAVSSQVSRTSSGGGSGLAGMKGSVTLGPDQSLGRDIWGNLVIKHNPKPKIAQERDAQRQENIINVNQNVGMMTGDRDSGKQAADEIYKQLKLKQVREG